MMIDSQPHPFSPQQPEMNPVEDSLSGTVLCVGAGTEQCPAIEVAQAMGLSVLAVDANPHAPGLAIANQSAVIDLKDIQQVIRLAQDAQVRCVLPVPLGAILTTVGAVNDALGLKGISKIAAHRCTDKLLMHQTLAAAGLTTPKVREAFDQQSICESAIAIGFPVILKPRYGSGSRGVVVARTYDELLQWLPWHLQQRPRWQPSESTLIEQFIDGIEIGVDSINVESNHSILLIRDKDITALPFRLPYAHLVPTTLSQDTIRAVELTLARAAHAIGLDYCLMHADVMISQTNEIIVLDISGRPSGYHLSAKLLPAAIGINSLQQGIYLHLGLTPDVQPTYQRAVVFRMLSAPTGIFRGLQGLEKIKAMPGIVAVECFLTIGDQIQETRTGATGYCVGYLISSGETRESAELLWHRAAQCLEFHVDPI